MPSDGAQQEADPAGARLRTVPVFTAAPVSTPLLSIAAPADEPPPKAEAPRSPPRGSRS